MNNRHMRAGALIILLIVTVFNGVGRAQEAPGGSINISSAAAYVIDEQTGLALLAKAADAPRPVASTTKIMTALLVLEEVRIDQTVTISARAAGVSGATIGLKAGETRKVGELLHALMLASANDAAVALAEKVAGSETAFVDMMNARARELGAKNTRFVNPHGLAPGSAHYSTAADLALMARAAMARPDFRRLVSTRRYAWETTETPKPRMLTNSNHLLETYPLATGVKTGYTAESGYCLVASADKGKRSAIAVVLGGPSREVSLDDARRLLDWTLNDFEYKAIVKRANRYGVITKRGKSVPVVAGRTLTALVYDGEDGPVELRSLMRPGIKLPIIKGEKLGKLTVVQLGKKIGAVDLVAGRSVSSPYVTDNLGDYFWRVVKKLENLF